MSGNISAVDYTNTIDQAHKASMNELTKIMAQMRYDADASKRFCGGSGSAARTAATSSLDVCGLCAGAAGHQHRYGNKKNIGCHVLWRSKNGFRMVNAKRTGSRHRRSRRKCAKTCWIWRYRINSFGALVKRNTEMLTKNIGQFVARWCCAKQQRKRKLHTVQKVLETTACKIKKQGCEARDPAEPKMPSVATGSVEVFGFDQTIMCSEELIRLYLEGELGMSIVSKDMTAI